MTNVDSLQYCIREAQFHLDKAKEILDEALSNPRRYREETMEHYRHMAPYFLCMMYSFLHREELSESQNSSQS
jgi:hypothetical protein